MFLLQLAGIIKSQKYEDLFYHMCVMAFIRTEPKLVSSERHHEDDAKENGEVSLKLCGPRPELIILVSLWSFIHPQLQCHGGFTLISLQLTLGNSKYPKFLS